MTTGSLMKNNAADRLLNADPKRLEDNIRQDIIKLLDSLNIQSFLSHRTSAGLADIYLPNRRVFIEVKAVGKANNPHNVQNNNETNFQQVERYLLAEMKRVLTSLPAPPRKSAL